MTAQPATTDFDLYPAPAATNDNAPTKGHNNPPPDITVQQRIDDLYSEARNFADGEPVTSQEMHDALEALYNGLHEAGKEAEELRKAEKKPHDDAAAAVQSKWNPYTQPKKGKVDMGKAALGDLLAVWRRKEQEKKAAEAAAAAEQAARLEAEAQAAIRASAGNLQERERAEEVLAESKQAAKYARRSEKAATTGTGLRSVWKADLVDPGKALDWAFDKDEAAFLALVQSMADSVVRSGVRDVPGFRVFEEKVAR